ncbi:MAG: hypothetical protein REI93_09320, partial [Pedobacter sp.]|nr:hypothetical protein [Pedobacter sp.]
MENQNQELTFHIGICMAGALSAGAYTAGVMDYLLETLEHWERAKTLQDEGKLSGIPTHRVVIDVIGGASAGGMTAALTVAALHRQFDPITQRDEHNEGKMQQNPLYQTWVNLSETKSQDMMELLLSTDDIEKDAH